MPVKFALIWSKKKGDLIVLNVGHFALSYSKQNHQ